MGAPGGTPNTEEWLRRLPGLDRLWSQTRGNAAVRIAVLDGPVDPRLLTPDALVAAGAADHGTHVCSVIKGGGDTAGIAPGCTVLPIAIFDDPPAQKICTQQRLAQAIHQALEQGAHIINVSASQQGDLLALSGELAAALQAAGAQDVLVVAASGNQGCECDTLPASAPGVLAVGAHDDDGRPLVFSNWGPRHRVQGVTAPGADVPGLCADGGLCRASGTSFATAVVSGVAGLLMSLDIARGTTPSGARVRQAILQSRAAADVDLTASSLQPAGRLCVGAAMQAIERNEISLSQEDDVTEIDIAMAGAVPADAGELEAAGLSPADCGCKGGGGCGCGGAKQAPQLVYAIGQLGVSFISQARRDSVWRALNGNVDRDLKPITDEALQELFKKDPFQAQSVIWTLSLNGVPIYAVTPVGPFAAEAYAWLRNEWSDKHVEFVAVPGRMGGEVTLYDGQTVPLLAPDLRGMLSWHTDKYVDAITAARKQQKPPPSNDEIKAEMGRFLSKIYFSMRNRGVLPEERAQNAAATNAFNFSPVITAAGKEGLALRDISVEHSPLSRPGGDYYDVLITFFDPKDRMGKAALRSRFTFDVSDTVPVMIGEPVTWYEY